MIVKIKKRENPFAMIDRAALEDSRLSFKARGILAYLLSKPESWEVSLEQLVSASDKDGVDSIRAAFKEFKQYGYAVLKTRRGQGGKVVGKFWDVYEVPTWEDHRHRENTDDGKTPTTEKNLRRGKTVIGKTPMISNKELVSNIEKEEVINTHTHAPAKKGFEEIDSEVEMNDPFLFQSVAEKMSAFFELNPSQWARMCHDTGYTGTAYDICLTWAGKQDKYTLTRWPQHIGKLTTWMKNESKNQSNGTNNNTGRTSQNDQRRKGETSQRALSIRERAARL